MKSDLLWLLASVAAYSQECLYCKRVDEDSSFLYSFSYCAATDTCLQDQWNYVNQWCTTQWIPGWKLDIFEDCGAVDRPEACSSFTSTEFDFGQPQNLTMFLRSGETCETKIDATQAVGRVVFDDQYSLGVLYNGY